jgi:hypothetical protein
MSLAPQAWRILRDLDKVFWSLPRSSGLWIRYLGPLAGLRASGMSGPLNRDLWDPGQWGPMGTHVSQLPTMVEVATKLEQC